MSEENVEIVRRLYADPRGLTAAGNEMVAPEAEFDFSAVYPDRPQLPGLAPGSVRGGARIPRKVSVVATRLLPGPPLPVRYQSPPKRGAQTPVSRVSARPIRAEMAF
jgi:hypothetical protein